MKSAQERKWLIGFGIALVIITTIPYLVGYFNENAQWKFTGFLFGVEDGNSYIAKMLNGSYGEWLFRTPYSAQTQAGLIAFLPYLMLGKLAAPPGLHDQLAVIYQIYRWLGIFLFTFASYDFSTLFLKATWQRRLAVIMIACGGGLGWLYFAGMKELWGGILPLDFYSPETFGFLELFGLPHLAVAHALLLWGIYHFLNDPGIPKKKRTMIVTAFIWFGIGFFQPMDIVIGWFLIGGYCTYRLIEWRLANKSQKQNTQVAELIRRSSWIILISSPWVIYNGAVFLNDSFGRIWLQQNVLLSPPIVNYLLAYGWLIPGVVAAIGIIRRKTEKEYAFVILWLALIPIFAYVPVNVQRRLVEGGWAAFVILALTGLENFWQQRRKTVLLYLAPVFLSSLIFIAGMLQTALNRSIPVFIPRTDVDCYRVLASIVQPDDIILADRQTSNSLPAWVNIRTLIGHGPESVGKDDLEPRVEEFFQGRMTPEEFSELISRYGIKYIFYSYGDLKKNISITPEILKMIQRIPSNASCHIYETVSWQ